MAYNKKKIIWLLLLYLVIGGLLFSRFVLRPKVLIPKSSNDSTQNTVVKMRSGTLSINDKTVNIEVAENESQWYTGLSNRESICSDCGMYFMFPYKDKLDFVMRDMKFPLDIIFIDGDKIINIAENLAPEGNNPTKIYSSVGAADGVLEVNGGFSNQYGIKAGDIIKDIKIN